VVYAVMFVMWTSLSLTTKDGGGANDERIEAPTTLLLAPPHGHVAPHRGRELAAFLAQRRCRADTATTSRRHRSVARMSARPHVIVIT
jgi:hypothetical protein